MMDPDINVEGHFHKWDTNSILQYFSYLYCTTSNNKYCSTTKSWELLLGLINFIVNTIMLSKVSKWQFSRYGRKSCNQQTPSENLTEKEKTHHIQWFLSLQFQFCAVPLGRISSTVYQWAGLLFYGPCELRMAVQEYMANPSDRAQTYGWPIGTWCVSELDDFSSIFYGLSTFNEDISNWNTAK